MARPINLRIAPGVKCDRDTLLLIGRLTDTRPSSLPEEGPERMTEIAPNFEKAYLLRFKALYEGACFLIESTPSDDAILTPAVKAKTLTVLKKMFEAYQKLIKSRIENENDVNEYKGHLYHFSRLMVETLRTVFHVSERTATTNLSKADEYQALLKVRPDLMTWSTLKLGDKKFKVLQREKPLPSLSEQVKKDLWIIKHLKSQQQAPNWYDAMKPLEQRFLRMILKDIKEPSGLEKVFSNPLSRLGSLPITRNIRAHQLFLLTEDGQEVLLRSNRLASSMVSSRNVKDQPGAIRDFYTFQSLKQILEQALDEVIDKQLDAMASRLTEGEEVTLSIPYFVQTLISPHTPIGPYEPDATLAKDKLRGMEVLNKYCQNELAKKILARQVKHQGRVINVSVKLNVIPLTVNHPLNYARLNDYTVPSDIATQRFADLIETYLKSTSDIAIKKDVQGLLVSYKDLLAEGSIKQAAWCDANARELFLSSLEQIIIEKIGGVPSGSCVSGKDRKGVELMHTDAMAIYHALYHEWPQFTEENTVIGRQKRKNFVEICAQLYVSGHHQESAALNAAGSIGIKTPTVYLPTDVRKRVEALYIEQNAFREQPLDDQDVLASHNELKSITQIEKFLAKKGGWRTGGDFAQYVNADLKRLVALQEEVPFLYPADAKSHYFLYLIQDIVKHDAYWADKLVSYKTYTFSLTKFLGGGDAPPVPDGIGELKKLFQEQSIEKNLLPLIYKAVIDQSIKKLYRKTQTQSLYTALKALFLGRDRDYEYERAITQLQSIYKDVLGMPPLSSEEFDRRTELEASSSLTLTV
jgi:hypothetical protein